MTKIYTHNQNHTLIQKALVCVPMKKTTNINTKRITIIGVFKLVLTAVGIVDMTDISHRMQFVVDFKMFHPFQNLHVNVLKDRTMMLTF